MKETPRGYYISDIPMDRKTLEKFFIILNMNEDNGSIESLIGDYDSNFLYDSEEGHKESDTDPYWNYEYPPGTDNKLTYITAKDFLRKYDESEAYILDIYKAF